MNILALDTTLGACSAAVARGNAVSPEIFGEFELREREHAETVMGMVEKVMGDAKLTYDELDAIAVTTGPGSFTGVRVGVAAARGLALACGKPLIGATSLEVMARQVFDELDPPPGVLAVAVDARRGEVYFQMFGASEKDSEPQALAPVAASKLLAGRKDAVIAGSGAALVTGGAGAAQAVLADLQPDARALARLALTRPPRDGPLSPLYLRPPDAKPQSDKALPRRK